MLILKLLLFLVAWLATLGAIAVISWWLRYAIAAMAAMLPMLCAFWLIWAWLVAIPVSVFLEGSAAETQVIAISHWLNDRTGDLLIFVLLLPFRLFGLVTDIARWLCGWA